MIDALLGILPPRATVERDALEFRDSGLFERPLPALRLGNAAPSPLRE